MCNCCRELRQLSVTWTIEQEKELEELYLKYKDEEGIHTSSHTLSHSHSHTLALTYTLALTHTHTLFLALTLFLTLTLSHTDVVGCIETSLDDGIPRSRRQIMKQLLTQGLVSSRKELTKKPSKPTKVNNNA